MDDFSYLHLLPKINTRNPIKSHDMPNGIPSLPVHGDQLKKILLVEPRSVRHTERISDLMYVLFRRSDT